MDVLQKFLFDLDYVISITNDIENTYNSNNNRIYGFYKIDDLVLFIDIYYIIYKMIKCNKFFNLTDIIKNIKYYHGTNKPDYYNEHSYIVDKTIGDIFDKSNSLFPLVKELKHFFDILHTLSILNNDFYLTDFNIVVEDSVKVKEFLKNEQ